MARPLKLEFPDALYHVTSRGDRRDDIYENDGDRQAFLSVLERVCETYNWVCHAYCLMSNPASCIKTHPETRQSPVVTGFQPPERPKAGIHPG